MRSPEFPLSSNHPHARKQSVFDGQLQLHQMSHSVPASILPSPLIPSTSNSAFSLVLDPFDENSPPPHPLPSPSPRPTNTPTNTPVPAPTTLPLLTNQPDPRRLPPTPDSQPTTHGYASKQLAPIWIGQPPKAQHPTYIRFLQLHLPSRQWSDKDSLHNLA